MYFSVAFLLFSCMRSTIFLVSYIRNFMRASACRFVDFATRNALCAQKRNHMLPVRERAGFRCALNCFFDYSLTTLLVKQEIMQQPYSILIVDDVPENIHLLGIMLQKRGYNVHSCTNGVDALRFMEDRIPDLLLLDISMPEMDGFELTRRLKSQARTREIPIIFLTAFTDKKRIVEGFDLGGVDYITKPYNAAELFARVQTHLDLKQMRDLLLQRNQELQILNERLRQLNLEKDELLGIVAHDLKSPLSAIRGLAEALVNDKELQAEKQEEFQQTILSTSDRMFKLISELLDANALDSGGLHFEKSMVDAGEILREIVHQYDNHAKHKSISFSLEMDDNAQAFTDKGALFQICDNFISNALKFSPVGKSIVVRARRTADRLTTETGSEYLRIEVRDEGQGLTSEDLLKIFGRYTRLTARPTAGEHSTGLGLGLSIAKKLADAIGARIGCESVFGLGATFYLELPTAPTGAL